MPELNVPSGSAESPAAEPPAIPGHKLLRCIGRGSYGEVWLGQTAAGEYRAVKIVFRKTFERERPFEREFSGIQKFEPVSRSSPSQVSILQVGRDDEAGFFYYVMELADDQRTGTGSRIDPASYKPKTLRSEVATHGRLPYDRALDISLSLAKALEHLHVHGLIHRDIKPSNIIFVDGVPKLADIGLVTDVGASISYVGTEGFLPPEGPVSKQADIYSLGKVLYEMSTGQDRMEFPELPTFLGESDEKQGLLELNLVFLKACQNDPHKRYRTAQEMYADLAILRSGKSLKQARSAQRRLQKVTRLSLAAACVAILVGLGLYAFDRHRIQKLRDDIAQRERDKETEQRARRGNNRNLVDGYVRYGNEVGGFDALPWYARALQTELEPDRAETHLKLLASKLEKLPRFVGFLAHGARVHSAMFSPDATRVVTAGADNTAKIWDVTTQKLSNKPLEHTNSVVYAELSPDNERTFTICADGTAWLWHVAGDATIAREVEHGAKVLAGQFNPAGRFILTRAADNRVMIWDGLSARLRFTFDCGGVPIDANYTPDGEHVCVATPNALTAWETERGQRVAQSVSPIGPINRVVFAPDSRRVLAIAGPTAQLWNLTGGEWSAFVIQEAAPIIAAVITPDGSTVIAGTQDGAFRYWDVANARMAGEAWRLPGRVREFETSADGAAAVVRTDERASLVELVGRGVPTAPQAVSAAATVSTGHVTAFSSDARLFLSASEDVTRIYELTEVPATFSQFSREGLLDMTRLFSGREVNDKDKLVPIATERILEDWANLRRHTAFQPATLSDWHAARATRFEHSTNWFALRFHAEALKKLDPANDRARAWSQQAARELAKAEQLITRPELITDHFPIRSPEAKANLIDLSRFYNVSLTQTWLPLKDIGGSNDLAQLPSGLQKFAGVQFDVRGLIQLSGSALENLGGRFPERVTGIPVDRKATNVHFLHGAAWDALYGTVIGKYQINYANGDSREVKIIFGRNVRDWWFPPTQPQLTMGAAVAWQGANPASRQFGMAVRIYKFTWDNPLRDVEIKSIHFESAMEKPAPFLLAITLQPGD
jgi:serine/threonine protein kinase/WD40 repeat protein